MDVETINFNGNQYPITISTYNGFKNESKLFVINDDLLMKNSELAINNLFKEYFNYIQINNHPTTIFVHNLGSFDGYFIYKALLNYDYINTNSIIDQHNKFIQISYCIPKKVDDLLNKKKNKVINFKDSYRIFPVSLNNLCKNFNVEGKINKYNIKYNDINLFLPENKDLFNEFKKYSIQDSVSLYKALKNAQSSYVNDYQIDITTILSTSTLSLKIFRKQFLNKNKIPILKQSEDRFIRNSYFGGATDYYKLYATNLKYYDVNSLYPYAMCKPIPHELLKIIKKEINIDKFFGFIKCEVICPESVNRPILPVKYEGKTIYLYGKWIGTYFSEELKEVIKLGYIIKPLIGYEFSKIDLFSDYVNHFYNKKKNSFGSERFIAKMHLNQLYGYFGRSLEIISTINIHKKDLIHYIMKNVIFKFIKLNNDVIVLLIKNNVSPNILSELNSVIEHTKDNSDYYNIKSNVAIASAVTSYARIIMIPYKILPGTVYTDTDSIFTTDKLPKNLIGNELGYMKDE